MNAIVKDRLSNLKESLLDCKYNIELYKDKIELQKRNINQNKKSIDLAEKLRKMGTSAIISEKISKGLEYANSYGIENVVFVGSEEVKRGKFKLKNMKSGKEEFLSEKELFEKF